MLPGMRNTTYQVSRSKYVSGNFPYSLSHRIIKADYPLIDCEFAEKKRFRAYSDRDAPQQSCSGRPECCCVEGVEHIRPPGEELPYLAVLYLDERGRTPCKTI